MRMVPQQLGEPGAGLPISLTGNVIPKIVGMAIALNLDSLYSRDRNRV